MSAATFTLDSPISINTDAYEKSHRHNHTPTLPVVTHEKQAHSSSFSTIAHHIFHPFKHNPVSEEHDPIFQLIKRKAGLARASHPLFFNLPKIVREKIYSHVYGSNAAYHILLRRNHHEDNHASSNDTSKYTIGHRRCKAHGHLSQCLLAKCKPMFDLRNGVYLGPFESILGLLLTAKIFYQETLPFLYTSHTFEFDHPTSYLLFSSLTCPPITKLTITIPTMLYNYTSAHTSCPSFKPEQWTQMWQQIASSSVEEVRVVFKLPVRGWMGWDMRQVLEPLAVVRGRRVFEVEMPVGQHEHENWRRMEEEARGRSYRLFGVFRDGERRVCGLSSVEE